MAESYFARYWPMRFLARIPFFSVLLIASIGLAACAALLPKSHSNLATFKSFDDARHSIESLVPYRSTMSDLKSNGLDPQKRPNITLLTQPDVIRRFVPGSIITTQDLDPGIVQCLGAREACRGLELIESHIDANRTGNFFSDFFNFHRNTHITGWRFNALVLLVNDTVVYRSWGGQPVVNEVQDQTNPLGPLQDIGPAATTNAIH